MGNMMKNFMGRPLDTPWRHPIGLAIDDGVINGQARGRLRGRL